MGAAGASFATAVQLIFLAQWLGQRQSFSTDENATIQVELRLAGWLQLASAVVLLAALGFMLWRQIRVAVVLTWRTLNGAEPEAKPIVVIGAPERTRSTPIGSAQLREGDKHGGRSRPVDGPAVGFSDERPARDHPAQRSEPPG